MSNIVNISGLTKVYGKGDKAVTVLDKADLKLQSGKVYSLVGPSGSGKSTLLHLLGLLDQPTSGTIQILGDDVSKMGDRSRTLLRREKIGFVYQFHYLLAEFSALENVVIPQIINGKSRKAAEEKATYLLEQVGLQDRLHNRPSALSGGEQQRVAIARSLANDPALLLADEPTGNLDPETADKVYTFLKKLLKESKTTALIATHNYELADKMDVKLQLGKHKVKTA